MSDQDKQAFEKWWMEGFKGMSDMDVIKYKDVGKQTSLHGWEAACEYKQKEIETLKDGSYWLSDIEKLQAENAKLKECVEFYANQSNWMGWYRDVDTIRSSDCEPAKSIEDDFDILLGGKRARQVLKELEDK